MNNENTLEKLKLYLQNRYPDLTKFTIVVLDNRSDDFVRHYIHKNIGGLLPKIIPFNTYKERYIAQTKHLSPLDRNEAFIRFHLFRKEQSTKPVRPEESDRLLEFLSFLTRFSIKAEDLHRLDRLSEDQHKKIDDTFALRDAFRERMAKEGFFFLPLEEGFFASTEPEENCLFVGIPLMTPVHETFFQRIHKERLFVPPAVFGPHFPQHAPEYESAFHIVQRHNIPSVRMNNKRINFTEVSERAALAALIEEEIKAFLSSYSDGRQMSVILLDEELSFYLWQTTFKKFGSLVNFSPWIPFSFFAQSYRIKRAMEINQDLSTLRHEFVKELLSSWKVLSLAERTAYEVAVSLCDQLIRLKPLIGDNWQEVSSYLVSTKKMRLSGSRDAPIQVVGLGEATGTPYERALILPMDRDIFPFKPLRWPFVNRFHFPGIYRIQFEINDLLIRQFIWFCEQVNIVARYDITNGHTPAPYFSFLAVEFENKKITRRNLVPKPFMPHSKPVSIPNDSTLKSWLRDFTWSNSTLRSFFSCPLNFLYSYAPGYKVEIPSCMVEEDSVDRLIGNIIHKWNFLLKDKKPVLEKWKPLLEEVWEDNVRDEPKFHSQKLYKPIVLSYLSDIAKHEEESGNFVLFSDKIMDTEVKLEGSFGRGKFRLTGNIDRLQQDRNGLLILDLKYKSKKENYRSNLLEDLLKRGESSDYIQLLIYTYLVIQNHIADVDNISAAFLFIKNDTDSYVQYMKNEEVKKCLSTMEEIAQLLEEYIEKEEFKPNYKSDLCDYCFYTPLCLHPHLLSRKWK